jgi:hypothetical protein
MSNNNELRRIQLLKTARKQSQFKAKQSQIVGLWRTIPKACGFEAATQTEEKDYNFKKQSQL